MKVVHRGFPGRGCGWIGLQVIAVLVKRPLCRIESKRRAYGTFMLQAPRTGAQILQRFDVHPCQRILGGLMPPLVDASDGGKDDWKVKCGIMLGFALVLNLITSWRCYLMRCVFVA